MSKQYSLEKQVFILLFNTTIIMKKIWCQLHNRSTINWYQIYYLWNSNIKLFTYICDWYVDFLIIPSIFLNGRVLYNIVWMVLRWMCGYCWFLMFLFPFHFFMSDFEIGFRHKFKDPWHNIDQQQQRPH